ncbi:hypothetical protein J4573_33605 [Actinomadura barringtoniae]|uniref:Organic solvent tolerance-like N-terminal domain-containing protein n=1 Tax=Actinomadura barringtoniae TaxID=1427535 RepID=A0A939TD93_9ACTN|nr:hypothetical protein [Actinomadura barringtoniae]
MVRVVRSLGLVAALAVCGAALQASDVPSHHPVMDSETTQQLTVAASSLVQQRSAALVQKERHDRSSPREVLGVRFSPKLVQAQDRAVHELENRNRAPVEGGPALLGAHTRLESGRAVRKGDRITLEAIERTEVEYENGRLSQSVRRRFEFTTRDEQITLVGERVVDPSAHPLNDADPGSDVPSH